MRKLKPVMPGELLREHARAAPVTSLRTHVHRGFAWEGDRPFAVVPQHEVLHRFGARRRVQRIGAATTRDAFLQFVRDENGVYSVDLRIRQRLR